MAYEVLKMLADAWDEGFELGEVRGEGHGHGIPNPYRKRYEDATEALNEKMVALGNYYKKV